MDNIKYKMRDDFTENKLLVGCYLNNFQWRLFCFLLLSQLRLKELNLFEELVPIKSLLENIAYPRN